MKRKQSNITELKTGFRLDAKTGKRLAETFGGTTYNSGGGILLHRIDKPNGHIIVISDDCICEYASETDFYGGNNPIGEILLKD